MQATRPSWASSRHRAAARSPGGRGAACRASKQAKEDATSAAVRSKQYSKEMASKMGSPEIRYRHEAGIDYSRIEPDLIVGSCLQTPDDVDVLAEREGVTTVFCLQEDSDLAHWKVDIEGIRQRCKQRGDIKHVRFPIRDFDPNDLRRRLPEAIARLAREHDTKRSKSGKPGAVYIHCTAGLGRAPGVAVAYMAWVRGAQVDAALQHLRTVRPCNPKVEAVRAATADLLLGNDPVLCTLTVKRYYGKATRVQVAGLDVGWNRHVAPDMRVNEEARAYELRRHLHPGSYTWKLIVDEKLWTHSDEHPTKVDGVHTNNVLEVADPHAGPERSKQRARLQTEGTELLASEKEQILQKLGVSS